MVLSTTDMFKAKKIILFFVIFLFLNKSTSLAQEKEKFIINTNPVRGKDFWNLSHQNPNDFVIFQKELATKNNYSVTWLVRPDYFIDNPENILIKKDYQKDDIGIFLEVTPSWTEKVSVNYNQKLTWYNSENIFLSGYNPPDRIKLIDYALNKFKTVFGFYPKSVGAWHIDPYTAEYLVSKYKINNFLICSDQTSTDGYQIWGGWWGVPYYPSKNNLLIPAQSLNDKLDAVVIWWAARDPVNGYGKDKNSLYSVQANDYLQLGLDTNYFYKLADIYLNQTSNKFGQLTIGLENDNDITKHKSEFTNQVLSLHKHNYSFVNSAEFAKWYLNQFPKLSAETEVWGTDPLNDNFHFKWINKNDKRIGLIQSSDSDWKLIDYRDYTLASVDPYKYYRNKDNYLYWRIPAQIDNVFGIGTTQVWQNQNLTPKEINLTLVYLTVSVLTATILLMKLIKKRKVTLAIILTSSLILSFTIVKSGLKYDFGLGFWGPNGHDGIWHLSLINQLTQSIPPKNPVFSGTILSQYHWGFDLLVAIISKLTFLSPSILYFQILPPIFAVLIGVLSYKLAFVITKNHQTSLFFVILNYFVGSFGWLYTLLVNRQFGGESLFWSMQSVSTLLNPPFALSLIIILIALILWQKYQTKSPQYAVFIGLILGLLSGVKVYAGILLGLSFSLVCFYSFFFDKSKFKFNLIICLTMAFVSLLILSLLGVLKSGSLIEFKPFWFTHSMIESIDKFYWPKLASFLYNQPRKLVTLIVELGLVFIFLVGNLGTRVLGLFAINHKHLKNKFSFKLLTLSTCGLAFIIPLFFVQKGTAWNTIQFFYYSLFFANFYLAIFISHLWQKHKIYSLVLLIITCLTSLATLKDYFGFPPPASLPHYEIQTLNFLKTQPQGVVLTYPYDPHIKDNLSTPIPLYAYETTAYVSAFSHQQSFWKMK